MDQTEDKAVEPATETGQSTLLACIEALGAYPIRWFGQPPAETYVFRRSDLNRMVDVDAPAPTDSAAGVVNPYTDEISSQELMAEIEVVMQQFLEDFQYPVSRKGDILDLRFIGPHIAWHLIRCGWRPVGNRRMIKKVHIGAGPQRMEDTVEWVDVNSPDQLDPDTLTVEQLKIAPAYVQAEAIRRLNGEPRPPTDGQPFVPSANDVWHQSWTIDADGDPEFKELMTQHMKESKSK